MAAVAIAASNSGPQSSGQASTTTNSNLAPPERIASRPENRIVGGEDDLYEIDVENREIYPLYWEGPTHHIRRATWFSQTGIGSTFQPCDENLARQLEDGYRKFAPWIPSHASELAASSVPTSISSSEDNISAIKPEAKWALFGPYMNQYAVYSSATTAWLQSDMLTSKLTRAVMYSSGIRLIRGWDEVCKLNPKSRSPVRSSRSDGKSSDVSAQPSEERIDNEQNASSFIKPIPKNSSSSPNSAAFPPLAEEDLDQDRQIDHLVFVIHGIGQKLSERIDAVNFPQDCNVLRKSIKDAARQLHERNTVLKHPEVARIPKSGGVQVLPIQWRQKVEFHLHKPQSKKDGSDGESNDEVTLEDITLDGIPGIRMLVSDVILDVLLYLTPKYRQEMIKHVSLELNRVYNLYIERNPNFKGKVSIYGHSLGSVLAYDILSHQHIARSKSTFRSSSPPQMPEIDISDALAMTLNEGRVSGLIEQHDDVKYVPFNFRVNALFAVGSPVALFLLLRGNEIRPYRGEMALVDSKTSRPDVKSLYNIFHPFDPVAHRFEPLVHKSFSAIKPVPIPYTKGGLTRTIAGIQDLGSDIVERGRSIFETMRNGLFSGFSTTAEMVNQAGRVIGLASSNTSQQPQANSGLPPRAAQSNPSILSVDDLTGSDRLSLSRKMERRVSASDQKLDPTNLAVISASATSSAGITSASIIGSVPALGASHSNGSVIDEQERLSAAAKAAAKETAEQNTDIKMLNPNGRIDYSLQEGVLENPYLSSLGVHMSYWGDSDCASFILKELHDLPSIPGLSRQTSGTSIQSEEPKQT